LWKVIAEWLVGKVGLDWMWLRNATRNARDEILAPTKPAI
jgi:hypothetical protein